MSASDRRGCAAHHVIHRTLPGGSRRAAASPLTVMTFNALMRKQNVLRRTDWQDQVTRVSQSLLVRVSGRAIPDPRK